MRMLVSSSFPSLWWGRQSLHVWTRLRKLLSSLPASPLLLLCISLQSLVPGQWCPGVGPSQLVKADCSIFRTSARQLLNVWWHEISYNRSIYTTKIGKRDPWVLPLPPRPHPSLPGHHSAIPDSSCPERNMTKSPVQRFSWCTVSPLLWSLMSC